MKITKRVIHRVTRFPTLGQPRALRSDAKETIEKNTGTRWNKRGMTIDTIADPLVNFSVRVISHKFYQSSRLNSVPCIVVDVGYKIVKRDHTYDLAELQLQQIMENLGAIRRTKVHNASSIPSFYVYSSTYKMNSLHLEMLDG